MIFPGKIIGTYQVGRSPLCTLSELLCQLKRPSTASSRHLSEERSRARSDGSYAYQPTAFPQILAASLRWQGAQNSGWNDRGALVTPLRIRCRSRSKASTHPAVTRRESRLRELAGPVVSRQDVPDAGRKVTARRAGTPRISQVSPSNVKGAPSGRVAKAMGASAHP